MAYAPPNTEVANSGGVPTQVGYASTNLNMPVSVENGITITSMPNVTASGSFSINGGTISVLQQTSPWIVSGGTTGTTPVQAATANGLTVNISASQGAGGNSGQPFFSQAMINNAGGSVVSVGYNPSTLSVPVQLLSGSAGNSAAFGTSTNPLVVQAATSNGMTVTGTVAVTQNTTPWTTSGSVAGGTVTSLPPATITASYGSIINAAIKCKSTSGNVTGWAFGNNGITNAQINVYDTSGAPSIGSTLPSIRIYVPAGGGTNISENGTTFTNGIWFAAVAAPTDTNTDTANTSPGANNVRGQLYFL